MKTTTLVILGIFSSGACAVAGIVFDSETQAVAYVGTAARSLLLSTMSLQATLRNHPPIPPGAYPLDNVLGNSEFSSDGWNSNSTATLYGEPLTTTSVSTLDHNTWAIDWSDTASWTYGTFTGAGRFDYANGELRYQLFSGSNEVIHFTGQIEEVSTQGIWGIVALVFGAWQAAEFFIPELEDWRKEMVLRARNNLLEATVRAVALEAEIRQREWEFQEELRQESPILWILSQSGRGGLPEPPTSLLAILGAGFAWSAVGFRRCRAN